MFLSHVSLFLSLPLSLFLKSMNMIFVLCFLRNELSSTKLPVENLMHMAK